MLASRRALLPTCILLVAGVVASCSGPDDTTPATPSAPATSAEAPSPSPTSSTGLTAADEAEVAEAWEKYWDARVAAFNGPNPDPALWAGFAGDEIIGSETAAAQDYLDNGIVFTGDVRTWDVRVISDGDTPVLVGCVDESGWTGTQNGAALPARNNPVHAQSFGLQRTDDAWLLTYAVDLPEGITC
ncbi:hypothetical protein [Cellulomonas sp. Leaf334]|uniref:hypothetical protein n=1 Tax=Cellulomonas sp. Leaf334 TaxID=1736339 RepID=UPI0006FFC29F|nr:hypothetical protein [Cellulomonas sp. Leaf334]KQR08535.1 hypothetical protein ASF78_20005 [Cellulomonas sp. Leaf334]